MSPQKSQVPPDLPSLQSIPLRDLNRPPDTVDTVNRIIYNPERRVSRGSASSSSSVNKYGLSDEGSLNPPPYTSQPSRILPTTENFMNLRNKEEHKTHIQTVTADISTGSGFAGLIIPGINLVHTSRPENPYNTENSPSSPYDFDLDTLGSHFFTQDSDHIHLTDKSSMQPISGAEAATEKPHRYNLSRLSFENAGIEASGINFGVRKMGDELVEAEAGLRPNFPPRSHSNGNGQRRSISPTNATGALSRATSIVRAMSQRVVNLSGEAEMIEASALWEASRGEGIEIGRDSGTRRSLVDEVNNRFRLKLEDDIFATEPKLKADQPLSSTEKEIRVLSDVQPKQDYESQLQKPANPLRGTALGIFSPENWIRIKLCDLLVYPLTEPIILALIIIQTLLLSYQSSQNVYTHPRVSESMESPIDYALFAIFIIFTLELTARIIVSGLVINPPDYKTRGEHTSVKAKILHQCRRFFNPYANASKKTQISLPAEKKQGRSFTAIPRVPIKTVEQTQRFQLARRAFLRHSFNRLDFVAVCAFWVAFVLSYVGIENSSYIHIARMLSCLRILRLLAITSGTAIILRSLKKAAPLLLNVSFLIGFFWLLFAIIGVQSFKSSLDRQCVWVDPTDPTNSTGSAFVNLFQFCGGQINITTGAHDPWVVGTLGNLSPGAESPKGFLCPRGSYCLQLPADQLPYKGTLNFDNIFQSIELVFVVMSANTFTDIMNYTMNSDYLAAAIFFAGTIVIMLLWLLNLLIAVITSSFQVIREESKTKTFTVQANYVLPAKTDFGSDRNTRTLKALFDKTYWLWISIIAFDIFCQTLQSHTMPVSRANFISTSQKIVTLVLFLEIIMRFLMDWRHFFSKNRNNIDLGLAVITMVTLIPTIRNSGRIYAWLTVFQILRIYRIILAVPVTRSLLTLVLGNSSGIANLILFVFLITFLVSILASQLFRGVLPSENESGETTEASFFTLWNTFLAMYQILSSENWTGVLYELTSFNSVNHSGWTAGIFFVTWFILGNFILVNMFIAVIQENFDVSEDEKRMHQVRAFLNRKELGSSSSNLSMSAIIRLARSRNKKDPLDNGPASIEMLLKDAVVKDFLDDDIKGDRDSVKPSRTSIGTFASKSKSKRSFWQKLLSGFQNREPNPFYSNIQISAGNDESTDATTMAKEAVSATAQRKKAQREYLARHPNYNTTLCIFKPNNRIRHFCQRMVGPAGGKERFDGVEPHRILWYTFSAIIYAAIVAMVVIACVTTPLYQKEYFITHQRNWFVWCDMAFAFLFSIEALIKVIADGFFWTPNAYFRSAWGLIDGVVLVTFWINVITSLSNDGAVSRAVGAFKAFRALRLLNFSDSARDTFHSLIIVGGWKIISAALVSLSLLVPFAIYGLNLFKGQMLSCNDSDPSSIQLLVDCFGEFNATPFSSEWPILAPRVVSNPFFDFDNFGTSLFILFQIVSQEGWIDVMWAAQSIVGEGIQPQPFASQGNAVFFVIFNLLATVFVLTLFISVFMRNYTEQTGVAFLTAEQRSWLELRKLLRRVSPSKRPPSDSSNKIKEWCYKRAVRKRGKWQRLVTIVLVLHLILLLVECYPQPRWWELVRAQLFFAFTLLFMANIVIRIIGLSWARFRRSSWDIYSIFVVFGSFGSIILHLLEMDSISIIRIHKLFLVMTVLLLIPRNNALDQLFKTAAVSVSKIGNLLATWFVLFLVYAIAMTQIFGLTRFGENEDSTQNFRTVPKALILLFRLSCGEGWNAIMEDYATILPPLCVSDPNFFNSDCGSSQWARALFISWNILSMYIFTSLFVSLIYESFSYVYQNSGGLKKVSREEIRRFKEAWAMFDPDGTGFISKQQFPRLLGELSGVFSLKIYPPENSVRQILEDIKKPLAGGVAYPTSTTAFTDINLEKLNKRLAQIDVVAVKQTRNKYNHFFEEVMVSADIVRGISFSTVLILLAHYTVISDNKSLKLDEFLRRRARLQRIEEQVRRRTVLGFFDTMYWSRRFRQYLENKSSQSNEIPRQGSPATGYENDNTKQTQVSVLPALGPLTIPKPQGNINNNIVDNRRSSVVRQRSGTSITSMHISSGLSPQHSPNRAVSTAFALESGSLSAKDQVGNSSRSWSVLNVGGDHVLNVLDNSAWGESIRRSFTMKQTGRGNDGFDHSPD